MYFFSAQTTRFENTVFTFVLFHQDVFLFVLHMKVAAYARCSLEKPFAL